MINKNGTLYHYVHCPFCIRVRMTLGFLNKTYSSKVLPYDDEATPIKLSGVKMLPIWQRADSSVLNESLEIIQDLDQDNSLALDFLTDEKALEQLQNCLTKLGTNVHNLAMPYWRWTPEFTPTAREYFEVKKAVKRGPLNLLAQRRDEFERPMKKDLIELTSKLTPWYLGQQFSIADIMIASHLWGLYVVPEFRFSDEMHLYLQSVKAKTRFNYHADFWRDQTV